MKSPLQLGSILCIFHAYSWITTNTYSCITLEISRSSYSKQGSCILIPCEPLKNPPTSFAYSSHIYALWCMYVYRLQDTYQMEWPSITMEITIISAQGLKIKMKNPFCRRIRPFITLTTNINDGKHHHVYRTKVDNHGGADPTWGDKFQLPIDKDTFDHNNRKSSCIYLQLYTKRLITGQSPLGWCQIPVTDIVNEFFPDDGIRLLSYQLRDRDGSRGHGVVNIKVKLVGLFHARFRQLEWPLTCSREVPKHGTPETVIGIPVDGTRSEGREFFCH